MSMAQFRANCQERRWRSTPFRMPLWIDVHGSRAIGESAVAPRINDVMSRFDFVEVRSDSIADGPRAEHGHDVLIGGTFSVHEVPATRETIGVDPVRVAHLIAILDRGVVGPA